MRVTSGTAQLQVQTFGDPGMPCVLLVMGAQASMRWWPNEFWEQLVDRDRYVIRFDSRDTGKSTKWPPGEPGYTRDDMADDLVAILDAVGIAKAHVIAVSGGGVISQIAALKYPERIASLVLVSTTMLGAEDLPPPTFDFLALAKRGDGVDMDNPTQAIPYMIEFQHLLVGTKFFDAAETRTLVEEDFAYSGGFASGANHFLIKGGEEWIGKLDQLKPPTVVIHGATDPLFPVEHGRALAAAIPGARFVELPGGHGLYAAAYEPIIDQSIA